MITPPTDQTITGEIIMKTRMLIATLGAMALMLVLPASLDARKANPDFAEDVQFANGNPSPSQAESNINEYTFQDEQINILPSDGVVKVLRTDQKVLLNDYITFIYPCKNVNPREIRGPIRTLVRKEGGEADVLQDKQAKQYYLHITCPRFQKPWVEACMAGLDEAWVSERKDGSAELYYKGKFRDVRKIQNISQFYITPEGLGRFYFDLLNNALYYTDQPAGMGLQSWGLSQIDIPPNEVRLEVAVYEIDKNNDVMLGLDWLSWKNGPGRNLFEFDYLNERQHTDQTNLATNDVEGTDFHRRFSLMNVSAVAASQFLDFVHNKGYVREVVKTSVRVKSGEPAVIEAVDSVVHFVSDTSMPDVREDEQLSGPDQSNGDEGASAEATGRVTVTVPQDRRRLLNYREAGDKVGVRLSLTPYVALESMELDVHMDVSSVNGYTPKGNPILGVRSVSDYVRLVDGQPLVMGGIDRETTVREKNGVPLLHKLPVVGWLFGREVNVKRQTQLVVVVTPQFILGSDSDLEMPQEARTIIGQATGQQALPIPKNPFGFDMWLLDK
ncbi:MAG: hypothetical protein Kow0059_01990 [Candidatus Sumerlaeia bacterium]